MRVFIDTNIYLRFIEPTSEKLEALSEFRKNVKKQKINLVFPQITRDELMRNIPVVMGRYTKPIKDFQMAKPGFPAIIKASKVRKKVEDLHKQYPKLLEELVEHYEKNVQKLVKTEIEYLIKSSMDIHEDSAIIGAAQIRRLKGNPPGKGGATPLGDEIEWEILLQKCFDDDITIISNDSDWTSRTGDKVELRDFLAREWRAKSDKEIKFYDTLSEYVKENITDSSVSEKEVEAEKKVFDLDSVTEVSPSQSTASLESLRKLLNLNTNAAYASLATISNPISTINPNLSSLSPFTSQLQGIARGNLTPNIGNLGVARCIVCGSPVANSSSVYCQDHLNLQTP